MRLDGAQLVLDTNILVHLLRGKAPGALIEATYGVALRKPRAIIPVVVKGEIRSFAASNHWQAGKMAALDELLATLPWADISFEPVLHAYSELDSYSQSIGRKMGKNDAWIAAIARVTRAVVLTTDQDFQHLHPDRVQVEYVDPPALLAGKI